MHFARSHRISVAATAAPLRSWQPEPAARVNAWYVGTDSNFAFGRIVRTDMTKLEQIESEIKQLSAEEFAKLRDWLLELDAQEWDRQIEQDAASGKLDKLFERSVADHRAGKSREI